MRFSRETLEQSDVFKDFVGDGTVVECRDILANSPLKYSTFLVVVLCSEHNPKPGDRYNLLRFFPMGDKITVSADKTGITMAEVLTEVFNQLIKEIR